MTTSILRPASRPSTSAPKSPPRTLQLVHSLKIGGAEILAERFARRLGGPERVVFACLDEPGPQAERLVRDGFVVEALHRRPGLDRLCVRRLSDVIRRHGIGLIHAHQYTPFFYAAVARGLSRRLPILFTEHGRFFPDRTSIKRRAVNQWLLGPKDRVLAVGECVKRALVENEGLAARRIEVVMNGVARRFDASPRTAVRRRMGIPADAFVGLIAARLDPIKDHATALRAWRRLRGSRPDAVLLIAGDGPERSKVEALAQELRFDDGARLLGSRSDVPALLAASDAALLTSFSEGIPLSLLEAMAAGLPVVATSVGGIPEVVVEERTGFLLPSGDSEGIAARLVQLAADPLLRDRLGAAGLDRVRERFSEEKMLRRYEEIHRDALR